MYRFVVDVCRNRYFRRVLFQRNAGVLRAARMGFSALLEVIQEIFIYGMPAWASFSCHGRRITKG
jgi:hypothetical protein